MAILDTIITALYPVNYKRPALGGVRETLDNKQSAQPCSPGQKNEQKLLSEEVIMFTLSLEISRAQSVHPTM